MRNDQHAVCTLLLAVGLTLVSFAVGHESGGRHRCSHTDPSIHKLFYEHSGPEAIAPQRYATERRFSAQARAKMRITLSTLDLDDSSKFCTFNGGVAPNFQGSTTSCTTADIFTAEKKNILLNIVLPQAISILTNALYVTPIEGNLVVPSSGCSLVTKAPTHTTSGVANTDYVLYVTAGPTSNGILAFAGPCNYDQLGRPIVGFANFGPSGIAWSTTNAEANEQVLATAVHEILHALGFSYSFAISRFVNRTSAQVVRDVTLRGKTTKIVITPEVVARTRAYFGCTSLEGAELEDEGGSGSALAHWDRRMFREELMTAAGGTRLSEMTLAFMKDSGHYDVDFGRAETLNFGRNGGCGFVTSKCNTNEAGKDRWFCFDTDNTNNYCTFDNRAIGYCDVGQYTSSLPTQFQYFTSPAQGGSEFMDYCPVVVGYSNRGCSVTQTFSQSDKAGLDQQGFYFGNGGRCFATTNLVQSGLVLTRDSRRRCLEARCPTSNRVEVRVGTTSTWLACPSDGRAATINAPPGFTGTIDCPAAATFCDLNITINPTTPQPATPVPPSLPTPAPPPGGTPAPPNASSTAAVLTPSPSTTAAPGGNTTQSPTSSAAAPTPIPPTPAPVPQTPVPLSTLPSGSPQTFQFATSLSVGQFNTATRIHLEGVVAIALSIPAAAVEVTQVLNGVGSLSGTTVVRIKVISGLSQAEISARLTAQISNSTSVLQSTYRVVGGTLQLVVDCSTVCNVDGTVTFFRTADNSACVCTCQNKFEGLTCSTCPSQYSGRFCDQCAAGLIGYPTCAAPSTCVPPTQPRYQPQFDIACSVHLSGLFGPRRASCEKARCACVGGVFQDTTGLCTTITPPSFCQSFICDGEERECLYQNQVDIMRQSSDCDGNVAPHVAGAVTARAWCVFDACIDSRNQCTQENIQRGCSAVEGNLVGNGARPGSIALLSFAVLALLLGSL